MFPYCNAALRCWVSEESNAAADCRADTKRQEQDRSALSFPPNLQPLTLQLPLKQRNIALRPAPPSQRLNLAMNSTKQHQQGETSWDKNGNVYKLQPASPSAPKVSVNDDEMTKHVPMAIPVPVDSPTTTERSQFPRRVASSEYTPWVLQIPTLLVFHLANFVFAVTAFVLVVTLFSLSIGLLPLCCFGVVVFQMLAWVTEYSTRLDIALANLIIFNGEVEKLRVHHRIASGFTAPDRDTLLSKMTFLSPQTIGAMLYFMTIKFAAGIVSCVVTACILGVPVCAITMATGSSHTEFIGFTYTDHPVEYVLSAIGIFVVGLWLLPIVASLSRKLTELVCAEKMQNAEAGATYV